MPRREQKLELMDTKLAEAFGWQKFKLTSMNGATDSLYMRNGLCFAVERKQPGKKLSRDQIKFRDHCHKIGVPHYVTDDLTGDQMRAILTREMGRLKACK